MMNEERQSNSALKGEKGSWFEEGEKATVSKSTASQKHR
jgi:hypothetical protein